MLIAVIPQKPTLSRRQLEAVDEFEQFFSLRALLERGSLRARFVFEKF